MAWPVSERNTSRPVIDIRALPVTIKTRSVSAGQYTAPSVAARHRGQAAPCAAQAARSADHQRAPHRRAGRRRAHQPLDSQTLFVAARTVEGHLTNVFNKLDLNARTDTHPPAAPTPGGLAPNHLRWG